MSNTILLVEDDDRLRIAVRRMLDMLGYEVIAAPHGAAALELLDTGEHAIDLVLSDVMMPQMTGIELAYELLEREVAIPILLMSGYVHRALERHGGPMPAVPLLEKPFTLGALASAVEATLGTGGVSGH